MRPFVFKAQAEGKEGFLKAVATCITIGQYPDSPQDREPFISMGWVRQSESAARYVSASLLIHDSPQPEPGDFLALSQWKAKDTKGLIALPFPLLHEHVGEYLWNFANLRAYAGPQPDTDGDNELGWEVANSEALRFYNREMVVCVRPHWITYGK